MSPPEGFRTRGHEPTGARLVLIRHGEAFCNARGVVGGPVGCGGLTELGRAQAGELRDRLVKSQEFANAAALYTSVLPRSIETARIISPGLPDSLVATEDCNLCELHPGEADGMTWDEMVTQFGGPDWDLEPDAPFAPGGESWTGFYERCRAALTEIARRHPGELVILVVHGGVIEQAVKMVEDASPETRLGLRTENCSMTEVEFDGERRRVLRYNDLAPLAAR
jgi:probable phosphoglycerate mutase